IAKFDQLGQPAPRLENAASRTVKRFYTCMAAGDFTAMADTFAADYCLDDRRRVVNSGIRRGRNAAIEDLRLAADVGFTNVTSNVIATRGAHLVLTRVFWSEDQRPEAFQTDNLIVTEVDAAERMAAVVLFDLDDFDAAIAELDAQYLAGEAAAHAPTWSVVAGAYASIS